jgi:hypothetical protein
LLLLLLSVVGDRDTEGERLEEGGRLEEGKEPPVGGYDEEEDSRRGRVQKEERGDL